MRRTFNTRMEQKIDQLFINPGTIRDQIIIKCNSLQLDKTSNQKKIESHLS